MPRLTRLEWVCLFLGVCIAHGFFVHAILYPSDYDAVAYVDAARDIAANGLLSEFSSISLRTYGYPLILSFVHGAFGGGFMFQLGVFEVQLVLFMLGLAFVRQSLVGHASETARIWFCAGSVNYYALLYTSDTLTESISLTLLLVATGCWLRLWQDRMRIAPLVLGSFAAGYAVMVRPANLSIAVAWVACCVLLLVGTRASMRAAFMRFVPRALAVAAVIALTAAPQIANNIRYFDKATPFPAQEIGRIQQVWGIKYLKYATTLPPIALAGAFYENPFAKEASIDDAAPWRWYLENPGRGLLTLALHVFNMTDQDLLFTYSRDLTPWYRVPLGLINHAVVALGLVGFALLGRAATRDLHLRVAAVALIFVVGAHVGIHAMTAVEMRFGLPLLVAFFPFAGYALVQARTASGRWPQAVAGACAVYVVAAMALSAWVRNCAPLIAAS